MEFDPQNYSSAVARLLAEAPRNVLGPGRPQRDHRAALAALTPEALVAPQSPADRSLAQAAISGLWLRFDFLDESHSISQDLAGKTGSYWHGIMHRREPDFGNAKYWFRRVGEHPVYALLSEAARQVGSASDLPREATFLASRANWDPFEFIDLCESARKSPELESFCREIQLREWQLLFHYCYQGARGQGAAGSGEP